MVFARKFAERLTSFAFFSQRQAPLRIYLTLLLVSLLAIHGIRPSSMFMLNYRQFMLQIYVDDAATSSDFFTDSYQSTDQFISETMNLFNRQRFLCRAIVCE